MKKGVFIAFEGIDGCGKSTQVRKLVQHILEKDKHYHVIVTRNPYKNTAIRKVLRDDLDPLSKANELAEMFINDRKEQVAEIILPNLKENHFIITDRFKLSTIAYQSAQGLDAKELIKKQSALPVPDICFIIDIPAEEASKRMKKEDVTIRGKEHKFEANLEFIKKIRESYIKAKELLPDEKIFIINGNRDPETITSEIKEIFDREIRH